MAQITAVLRSLSRWLVGFLMVLMAPLPALVGYFAAACPGDNPLGLAMVAMLAFAIRFPPLGMLFALCAVLCWPTVATSVGARSMTTLLSWWAVTIACIGLVSWLLSTVLGATTRCSLLW